jgi:hypothetical protein
VASAEASPEGHAAPNTADETSCNRQTWPYIDQRCAQRVNAARDTRKVRIVTDKGNSVEAVTPVPVVEAKDKPKPVPQPTVARTDDRTIGPQVAPGAPADEAPQQTQQTAAVPQQQPASPPQPAPRQAAPAPAPVVATATPAPQPAAPPAATNAMAQDRSKPANNTQTAAVAPSAASAEPVSPGVDAMDNLPPKKSKAERAAEKAEKKAKREAKREAKHRQKSDDDEEIAAIKPAPLEEQSAREERKARAESKSRRGGRSAVPDDVIAEVERATRGREDSGRRRIVIGDPRGQRVIIVPREEASGW